MAGSPLPLVAWFTLTEMVHDGETSVARLSRALNLRRLGTVRRMLQRVQQALDAGGLGFPT
jgi:hypothetical protein